MKFREETIGSLFSRETDRAFSIPDYQRAYSWENETENKPLEQFFDDVYEQSKSENNYFLGNILVEDTDSSHLEIIDGQQRITTIVIFMRSFVNILTERSKSEKVDINISEIMGKYIAKENKDRLIPSQIDQEYFSRAIINNTNHKITSRSQQRIKKAKTYFSRRLKSIKSTAELVKLYEKLEKTLITVTTIDNKTDSAFIFELQNNRGRDITEMEQVKAFLMYHVYVNEDAASVKSTLGKISESFENIYLYLNDIKTVKNEDNLLWWHCYAWYGYEYIDANDFIRDFLKKRIDAFGSKSDKIAFISGFVSNLQKTFACIHKMERTKSLVYLNRLNILGISGDLYPIIINAYRFMNDSDKNKYLAGFFRICEFLAFRLAIIPAVRNFKMHRRLDMVLNFEGNLETLYSNIKNEFGDDWRWSDDAMDAVLFGPVYEKVSNKVIHYIYKIYEQEISGKECPKLSKISIEHISPQTPEKKPGSGYELTKKYEYGVRFKNNYLHCLGNLALSTEAQQKLLDNKPFNKKLEIYTNPETNLGLKHQKEMPRFLESSQGDIKWGIREIEERRKEMIEFIKKEWSFEAMDKKIKIFERK